MIKNYDFKIRMRICIHSRWKSEYILFLLLSQQECHSPHNERLQIIEIKNIDFEIRMRICIVSRWRSEIIIFYSLKSRRSFLSQWRNGNGKKAMILRSVWEFVLSQDEDLNQKQKTIAENVRWIECTKTHN